VNGLPADVHQFLLLLTRHMAEGTGLYLLRLFAFLLILGAIIDKNRAPRA
jgi:hypothetical protein